MTNEREDYMRRALALARDLPPASTDITRLPTYYDVDAWDSDRLRTVARIVGRIYAS